MKHAYGMYDAFAELPSFEAYPLSPLFWRKTQRRYSSTKQMIISLSYSSEQ